MASRELKWKKSYAGVHLKRCETFRLTDDMLVAFVTMSEYEEGIIEAIVENRQRNILRYKLFKFKMTDVEKINSMFEEAKGWAKNQMLMILEKNLEALKVL